MKRGGIIGTLLVFFLVLFLISVLSFSLVSAASIDSEIKKITHYAEEYETGNINYVQLLIYVSAIRGKMNEMLGATEKQIGGVLKQEKIKEILGEPNEETKWVWVEGEEHDKKLDNYVPVWKKIIFDGKKIQIRLEAFPSIFTKKQFEDESKDMREKTEKAEEVKEGDLIYRLHFSVEFKKPEEQLDILGKINEIKSLAEIFNTNPTRENAEALAKESVNAERTFESYFRQNQGKCEDIMASIFGSENQMQTQNMIVQEISFYSGEKFEVIARLEMCDECEWNWINLDLWTETRSPMPGMQEPQEIMSADQFKDKDSQYFKTEIINLLDEYKKAVDEKNWKETNRIKQKIWIINEAWNQKSNDVWKEIDESFKLQIESMTQEQREEFNQNYGWIKQDQERRKKEKEIRKQNYEERKQFYLGLFADYDKKEYSFSQIEFKKRLIEEFKEFGEEICNNNQDDNKNEKVDCDDEQCGGKICGKGIISISDGNETKEKEVDFYCIAGECKVKEEIIEIKEVICGNHICEENETIENCAEDCSICQTYSAINCSGRVIFSGTDKNGCPLEPRCIEEKTCSVNEDCMFLCGEGECIEGKCQVRELRECEDAQCTAGDEKILNCQSGEQIVVEECINGLWEKTGVECAIENVTEETCESYCLTQPHIMCVGNWDISGSYPNCNCNWVCQREEEIVGNECNVREDCGSENDVCSNGRCVTIPQSVPVEPEQPMPPEEQPPETPFETPEEPEETQPEETEQPSAPSEPAPEPQVEQPTKSITAQIIKTITGFITGFQTQEGDGNGHPEEQPPGEQPPSEQTPEQPPSEGTPPQETPGQTPAQTTTYPPGEQPPMETPAEGFPPEERREEDKERCRKDCNRPCIEKCIRENCGEEMECDINEERKKCEESCKPDDSCVEKCMKGGDWWKEFEQKEEHKEEKGVFEAGGSCRTAKARTEGFIWFGGWGDPFEQIQQLKHKYYSGGNADWCKYDLQNLIRQRQEFEKGFNQEFVTWFFEKHLANSAEDWEQSVSGIFELYWSNVNNQREIANRMKCLEKNNINEIMNYNLINIKYETEYGSIEYWEEVKEVSIPGLEKPVIIISPYMKIWIFPPKTFFIYEMKKAMKNHEFPGPPEEKAKRKNEEGPTAEEKEMIRQNEKFMNNIRKITEKYNGNLDAVIQFKNYENDEVVFNLYVQVNEKDIIKISPMLPSEVPAEDVKVEIDIEKIYDLVYGMEKEMRGAMIESPPWDRKPRPVQKVKEVINGIKMFFKIRSLISSAKVYPSEARSEIMSLFKSFFSMMQKGEKEKGMMEGGLEEGAGGEGEDMGEEKGIWEEKRKITGEVIGG